MRHRSMGRLGRLFPLLLLLGQACFGQIDTGTIAGTIRDPSGALVAGAAVTLRSRTTRLESKVSSNELGQYVSPPLRPGPYEVAVEAPGFRRAVASLVLTLNQRAVVDFSLQVGAVEETVTVEAEGVQLESESSTLGNLQDEQAVKNLPLNTRNFNQLLGLATGVVPAQTQSGGLALTAVRGTTANSVNGLGFRANNYRVDGLDNAENHNGQGILIYPPVEAIQEFRMQTSAANAEFGRGGGGSINVTYKSGGRDLHGSLFEFFRNSALDAKNFFDNPVQKIAPFRMNQFGATVGGPVLLPRVYNRDRGKTFFFFSWEAERRRQALTYLVTVPLPEFKQGDFSASALRIYDPLTLRTDPGGARVRDQFAGNRIPANRLDQVGRNLINLYPSPNRSGLVNNYGSNPPQPVARNNYDVRIDHNFSPSDQTFFRFSWHYSDQDTPPSLPPPAVGASEASLARYPLLQFVGSYTRTISPRVINEFRGGATRLNIQARHPNWGRDAAQEVGIPGVNVPGDVYASGLTRITLAGFEALGDSGFRPAIIVSENYQFNDALTWVRGSHTLKFGGELGRRRYNLFQDDNIHGAFGFGPIYTTNPAAPQGTGISLADMLLGVPASGTIAYLTGTRGYRRTELGLFAQDTWKVTNALTLNVGLRYEVFGAYPWLEVGDRMAYFRPELSYIYPVNTTQIPERSGTQTDRNNIGPRVGFAYKLGTKTVLRAAYGLFFSAESIPATSLGGANPPFVGAFAFSNDQFNFAGARRASQGFERPAGLRFPPEGAALQSVDPRIRTAYAQHWNFGIQRNLPAQLLLTASYVGTSGKKLVLDPNINQARPGPGAVNPRRPWPQFNNINWVEGGGSSSYHSLQVSAEKRMSGGLNFLVSYTWAHAIDNGGFLAGRQNFFDLAAERGNGDVDLRHRLVVSHVWEIPVGRGRRWGQGLSRAADAVLGGWQVNGISSIYSGLPFTPSSAVNTLNGSGSQRPDRTGDGSSPKAQRSLQRWFDIAAFRTPGQFLFGNAGRNILKGPGTVQFDVGLAKNFRFREPALPRVEFRSEFFNIFNTPQFNNPNAAIGAAQAGVISSAGSKPTFQRTSRQIQFALKLYF